MKKTLNIQTNIKAHGKLPVGQHFVVKSVTSTFPPIVRKRPHKGETLPYLGDGFVRFIDVLGTDKRICEAARISYKAKSKGEISDRKLIRYLIKNRHTSPLEQCSITFNIKMPIFIMRQFVRHRMFRLNEVSARYTKLPDEMYHPKVWKLQAVKNKQGSKGKISTLNNGKASLIARTAFRACRIAYERLLGLGISKEQARVVLPVAQYTEIYVNCDLHNLMHFLRLREHKHAQEEIRWLAQAMHEIAERLFPVAFDTFNAYRLSMTRRKGITSFNEVKE